MSIKDKLTSRKLWAAVVGVILGVATIFGLDEGVISTVSGAIMAMGSVIIYIVTEGKIDAAAVGNAAQQIQEAVEKVVNNE